MVTPAKKQAGVDPTKPERIREDHLSLGCTSLIRHVIQVASGIRMIKVDRRRKDAMVQRKDAEDSLNPAGGAQEILALYSINL